MVGRVKNHGKVLLRRSTSLQEKSLEQQLDWAVAKAAEMGVPLNATRDDLSHMQAARLCKYKDLYVDDAITGSNLQRPGLSALRHDAKADHGTSHIFVYHPDRLARPQEATAAVQIEIELCRAGITLVFSNRIASPRQQGINYIGETIQALCQYNDAGEFLNQLAQRVLNGHIKIAEAGYWAGGRAPYGHARVLVDASGNIVQELRDGMKVRADGCRVRIMPKDQDKIRIWVLILEWYYKEKIGANKIARRLNEMEIPSPDAGRSRTDNGVAHKVSGKWSGRTVLTLLRNTAIVGLNRYGVQSEGSHRRLGDKGPRLLESADAREDGSTPKVVQNPKSVIISRPTGFAPSVDVTLFDACQRQLEERGKTQRGISRRRDPARYPLALRVWDMSPGCGHPMYARTAGERPLYVCGLYEKTSGARCEHNAVDGEAALSFVLNTLTQQVERLGGRDALRGRLLKLAEAQTQPGVEDDTQRQVQRLDQQLAKAEEELGTIRRNFVLAKGEAELEIFRMELAHQQAEAERVRTRRDALLAQATERPNDDPAAQIEAALSLYDELQAVAKHPAARSAVQALLEKINLRLWLNFGEGTKGKRKVRVLQGGILTTGDAEPPIRPYGNDNDGGGPHAGRGGPGMLPVAAGVNETPSVSSFSQPEGVSFTMVNRGDRI